jgi:NADPH2:quinone reductase
MMKAWVIKDFDNGEIQIEEVDKPNPKPRDLLVKVMAVATNPVDEKICHGYNWGRKVGRIETRTPGWDASGIVEAVGEEVKKYHVGDQVYFSGDVLRPGCFAEYTLVDERIVGTKPKSLTYEEAAALPLTFLTAYEGLNEGFGLEPSITGLIPTAILIVNGAGGLGSATIQLAKKVFGLTVIATASRPESKSWCFKMGADYVIDHKKNLLEELNKIGFKQVPYLFNAHSANKNWEAIVDCLEHLGKMCVIIDLEGVNLTDIWFKRITVFPELMFSRPLMLTGDDYTQMNILNNIAELIDEKVLVSTKNSTFQFENLPEALKVQGSGILVGKQTSTVGH